MADKKPGLWANIHAKRQRGEAPAKPGDSDYPDSKNWKKVTNISEKKGTAAWQKSEGKNPEGGLNEKGRASLKAQGHDIKRPQPEGGARKDSFCARMKGMKSKLTSSETARDPDSRINKSLRKWKCGSAYVGNDIFLKSSAMESSSMSNSNIVMNAFGMRPFTKQANPILDAITSAPSRVGASALGMYQGLDPVAQNSIMGALIGGGAGGIGNVLLGDKKKSMLKRLGMGALGGSAIGAGGAALGSYIGEKIKDPLIAGTGKVKELAEEGAEKAKGLAEKGVEKGKKTIDSVGKSLKDVSQKAKDLFKGKNKEDKGEESEKTSSYRGFEKEALMEEALKYYQALDPTIQAAILGGAGGSLLGGAGNALFGRRKPGVGLLGRLGRGALTGGLLGSLGGAGVNEAAIRLGMLNSGNTDRASHVDMAGIGDVPRMPSQMANEALGSLPEYLSSIGGSAKNLFKRTPSDLEAPPA